MASEDEPMEEVEGVVNRMYISRIRVTNFMCHDNMDVELGGHSNFIIGRNGSGKSAVLTALCVGLGTRAKTTQRASTVKDFIKHGCEQSTVEVTFKNIGVDAYFPDTYGDKISVIRKITRKGASSFEVRNSTGKKVGQSKADVDALTDHMGLDVDNPCSVLSQDQSRQFLHSGNPADRYSFFINATRLFQIQEFLLKAKSKYETVAEFLDQKKEEMKVLEREKQALQEKLEATKKLDEMKQELRTLRHKKAWAEVYAHDDVINEFKATINKVEGEGLPKIEEQLRLTQQKYQEAERDKNGSSVSYEDLTKRVELINRERKMLVDQMKATQKEMSKSLAQKERMKDNIEILKVEREKLEKECENFRSTAFEEISQQNADHVKQLEDAERILKEAENELAEREVQEGDLIEKMSAAEEAKSRLEDEERFAKEKWNELRQTIAGLKKQENDSTQVFGKGMPSLLRAIERRKNEFHRLPLGPIGSYLSLSDTAWATAVEESVGNLLGGFICADQHDSQLLQKCCREANVPRPFINICKGFDKPLYAMPADRLPPADLLTVIKVLAARHPTVMNVLIDNASVERQVLVKETSAGRRVAFSGTQNVKEVFTQDGTKLFARGRAKNEIARNSSTAPRLGVNNDDRIRMLDAQRLEIESRNKSTANEKRKRETEISGTRSEMNRLKKQKTAAVKSVESAKNAIIDLKENAPNEARSIDDEVADMEAAINDRGQRIRDLEEELANLAHSPIDEKIDMLKKEIKSKEDASRKLKDENDANAERMEAATLEFAKTQQKAEKVQQVLAKMRAKLDELVTNLKTAEEERAKDHEMASRVCSEEEIIASGGVSETIDRLEARLKNITKRIERQEREQGFTIEQVVDQFDAVSKRLIKAESFVFNLSDVCVSIKGMLKKRFDALKSQTSDTMQATSHRFNQFLGRRGATGRLLIDPQKGTLDINARMNMKGSKAKDTKTFSGGERSFVTMAFILALAKYAEPPLIALDEYDIYMDNFNRKLSTKTLMSFANEQKDCKQFILITPHEIGHIIDSLSEEIKSNVKILRMRPPRREEANNAN